MMTEEAVTVKSPCHPPLARPPTPCAGAFSVPRGVKLKNMDLTVSLEGLSFFLVQGETDG